MKRLLTILLLIPSTVHAGSDAPNILMILSDDHGWSQVSRPVHPDMPDACSKYLETPNLDRLAAGGMTFTSGYAPAPICTPTRRSIQCGTSAARSGSEAPSTWVPAEHLTIPTALKSINPEYRCAHFGKWGNSMGSLPEECGYDASDGQTCNPQGGYGLRNFQVHVVEDPKRTSSVTGRSIDFIRKQISEGHPFYVQVSYYALHLRIELLQSTWDKYKAKGKPDRAYTAAYAGMLEEMDTAIGQLLDTLEDLGIADNTYVVFMADNGAKKSQRGGDASSPSANTPLSGQKWTTMEGGLRVPFFVRGPGIKAGTYCHTPVSGYDLMPTFYEMAGGSDPMPEYVDGGSILPLLLGESDSVERPLDGLVFFRSGTGVLRRGNYKLTTRKDRKTGREVVQLYDLSTDIAESEDISAAHPELTANVKKTLLDYFDSIGGPKGQPEEEGKKKE